MIGLKSWTIEDRLSHSYWILKRFDTPHHELLKSKLFSYELVAAYKGLVRPVLDYGSLVWDPPVEFSRKN